MTAACNDEPWFDGAPLSRKGVSCVACGGEAAWLHMVQRGDIVPAPDGVAMPWTFCDICDLMYLYNQDTALVEVMKHSGVWEWESEQDVELDIIEPLAALRRTDQGSRQLTD